MGSVFVLLVIGAVFVLFFVLHAQHTKRSRMAGNLHYSVANPFAIPDHTTQPNASRDSLQAKTTKPKDKVTAQVLFLLEKLAMESGEWDFSVRLWDGTIWNAGAKSNFTIIIKRPEALRAIFAEPSELRLGEAYIFQDLEVEGDLKAAFTLADALSSQKVGITDRIRLAILLRRLPASRREGGRRHMRLHGSLHSQQRDRQAIRFHYDVSNDFYSLWLDQHMIYSCGYFESPQDDIDTAQTRKLDYICRKLRLKAGERLLNVGCGWGGLIIHAAGHYGVHAVGLTLSEEQAKLARERIEIAGLSDHCRVEVGDYREHNPVEPYDKVASVGMFEHVGQKCLPEYFERVFCLLRSGGVFVNHGIAATSTFPPRRGSFIDRYVFPDGDLVPIDTTLRFAESAGFEVRDLESLREHYALTLERWLSRLDLNKEQACKFTNETTYRIWRLYMAGSAHAFRTRRVNVYQSLLSKPDKGLSGLPLTREDWYLRADT